MVVYAQDTAMWATRLWWELRYFGFDAELRHALEAAGALGECPMIAYCGGGISATVDLFALSLVGRDDARLYDGSLTEWTRDPALPLELG